METSRNASHRKYGKTPERLIDEAKRDATEIREQCYFCDWLWVGPAGEGREAARAHRLEAHPKAPKKMGRPRKVEA